MNYLKDNIVKSLLFVLVGAILIFNPGMANNTIAGIISLILVINGVVHIIGFIRANGKTTVDGYKSYGSSSGLIIGIISIVFAALIGKFFVSFIPIVIGVLVLVSGLGKLREAMNISKLGENATIMYILAAISILIGLVVLFNPFETANLLVRIIGIGLVYDGITNLIATGYFSGKL